jgi:hypothetical protein
MSPIAGLTDRSPSFKEIGRLRLGIPKSEAAMSGPKEIGWFRADFRPDAQDALVEFMKVYGQQPTEIHFRLPFAEINRCWDANYEVYNKFGMLGMADGKRWMYLRHNKTGELLVKDGVPTHAEGTKVNEDGEVYLPFDPKVPVYSYTSKKGEEVKVYARPTGRLRILIPELKRAAYVQIITNSLYNCIHLSEQLAGVAEIAKNAGMSLPQVPLTITRRKELISVTFNGHKQMQEHYLLNIEIDPLWMEAQFNYLATLMPGTKPAPVPVLSAGIIATKQEYEPEDLNEGGNGEELRDGEPGELRVVDLETGEVVASNVPDSQPAKTTVEGLANGTPRPYSPETLKAKLLARATNYDGKTATVKQRNLAAILLGEIFAGPDSELMRHALQTYLFGVSSLKELHSSLILVLLNDWLKPIADSGGAYHPDAIAVKEAIAAYEEAVKTQGQMALPLEKGAGEKVDIPF